MSRLVVGVGNRLVGGVKTKRENDKRRNADDRRAAEFRRERTARKYNAFVARSRRIFVVLDRVCDRDCKHLIKQRLSEESARSRKPRENERYGDKDFADIKTDFVRFWICARRKAYYEHQKISDYNHNHRKFRNPAP